MREKLNNSEEKHIKNTNKEDNFFPDLKMLNYNKIQPIKIKKKSEDFINIDLKKLLKYSKQGKNLNYNIFNMKKRNINNNLFNKKYANVFPFITQTTYEFNDDFNYNDTINLVKNNANNGMLINDVFKQKKKILDSKLDIKNLPTLTFYEKEIKAKTQKIKRQRQKNNEPYGNGNNWESMYFDPKYEAAFVRDYMGPAFEKSGFGDVQILGYDQNRNGIPEWVDAMYADPQTAKYFGGLAVHWYESTCEWQPDKLNYAHDKNPNKLIIETEGCCDADVPHWKW